MSSEEGGFFSRWSRRKSEVRGGAAVPPEPPPPVRSSTSDAITTSAAPIAPATTSPPPPSPSVAQDAPPLTLDDVRELTPDADFKPFVARDVAPEVRNAAFKKLFADPKFNVMDGLDIYIDDYSKPDPLPVSLARQLVSARSLGLFEDKPESKPAQPPEPGSVSPAYSEATAGVPNPEHTAGTPASPDTESPPPITAPPTSAQP